MSSRLMVTVTCAALAALLSGGAALSATRSAMPIDGLPHLSRLIHDAQSLPPASHRGSAPVTVAACSSLGDNCSSDGMCCNGHCVDGGCQ
jgi:hypothetical protein